MTMKNIQLYHDAVKYLEQTLIENVFIYTAVTFKQRINGTLMIPTDKWDIMTLTVSRVTFSTRSLDTDAVSIYSKLCYTEQKMHTTLLSVASSELRRVPS